jgi:ribosomal protein S15P/S13E
MEETKTAKTVKKIPERAKVEDIAKLVIDIAKTEKSPAKMGEILNKKHGIKRTKVLGKKITHILKENKIQFNTDLDIINKKISKIEQHSLKNKQDKRAKRELVKFIGLRKKLEKYEQKSNKNL